MSKSTRMTPEQLRSMGLEEYEPGKFRPKSKSIILSDDESLTRAGEIAKEAWFDGNKTDRHELDEQGIIPSGTKGRFERGNDGKSVFVPDKDGQWEIVNRPNDAPPLYQIVGIDPVSDEPSHSAVVKRWADGTVESVNIDRLPRPDLIEEMQKVLKYHVVQNIVVEKPKPFDIAAVRALGSGTKARKQSMEHLHQFAKELVENRGMDSIYIKGNVASSKNSKEIAKFKKKVMGKTVEMTSLIDSKATRAYRTETSRQWGAHLQHFKDIVKDKQYPLSIHFTFIRKTLGRFDLVNAAQGPLDIMVEKGYIEDDSSEHVIPVFNPVVYYSKEYAGLLIKVL